MNSYVPKQSDCCHLAQQLKKAAHSLLYNCARSFPTAHEQTPISTAPMAQLAKSACGRNLGLGQQSRSPPRPVLAWSNGDRRLASDGQSSISEDQNPGRGSP